MSCSASNKLCEHLVISQSVAFTNNQLVINIPAGSYEDDEKYCIIVGQSIPATTTIAANVVITIGSGTTTYPLVNNDCTNVSACQISSRTRYSVRVHTNIQSGVFKLIGRANCTQCGSTIAALPITKAATAITDSEQGDEEDA
jgi:hypothetical protein